MKAKERPDKNGVYIYCAVNSPGCPCLMHYRDGRYSYFKPHLDDPEHSYDIDELINNGATWRFWGPLKMEQAA